ncbi:hypothetical protein EV129_10897 [Rhizobium azibense]|uniref:Uncharacterized protein n=1 Tax=Rhizobium azibense TaxID=1136135 RepID=A0A4R3RLA1_9HYPH|nr:hypothetical protein EV129_10897 [Rhizobium azibense]
MTWGPGCSARSNTIPSCRNTRPRLEKPTGCTFCGRLAFEGYSLGVVGRVRVQLAIFGFADLLEEVELRFEEVDMPFLIGKELLE